MKHCRVETFPLQPTYKQRAALVELFDAQRHLYNAALEERRGAWEYYKRGLSTQLPPTYYDQCKVFTQLRQEGVAGAEYAAVYAKYGISPARGTLDRLQKAYNNFFGRVKRGETPGYPRFKSKSRFDSVQYASGGFQVDIAQRRIKIHGIGNIRIKTHRKPRGVPKTMTIKRIGHKYVVTVAYELDKAQLQRLPKTNNPVGIDLGVAHLATTSDGVHIANPAVGKILADKLAKAQQELARHHKGSSRFRACARRVARLHRKIANARLDTHHKVARRLVDRHDFIAHEDLNLRNMTKSAKGTLEQPGTNVAAKSGLNRAILDAGMGQLLRTIAYKAEEAGRQVVAVNPRHTSVTCSECGHTDKASRKSQAVFICTGCGHSANADVNAAINILRAGLQQAGRAGQAQRDGEATLSNAKLVSRSGDTVRSMESGAAT